MARLVMSNSDVYSATVYGQPHPSTLQFLQNSLAAPTTGMSDASLAFLEQARQTYEAMHGDEAIARGQRALSMAEGRWGEDRIRQLLTLEELQLAPLAMQRYLMACVPVREMYHRMEIDGYSDTYVDMQPGLVGDDHYDYRRVVNGMVNEDESYAEHIEELIEGDRELYFHEQVVVKDTWQRLLAAVWANDEDPTSRYGDML